ncbi:polyprenyl diphosphate synthase [Marinicella gelatinilytica]|uniref:polyprenyl diphosphate synthase n=1 Tax=Marinicella gelatinilytica TaxID=2996017 RepID=UPI002260E8FC|nr:polyprenyl diphosphate synthase [Marinicella gelatinilytica]MCX7544305.1 polyprenyl diphosphate synthase [Marinicella gelatinilytica]
MNVQHIAIIMDGNGRWAAQRKRPRTWGHKAGVKAVKSTLKACVQSGISHLTLFAFSSENWRRPQSEVKRLMTLFLQSLEKESPELLQQGVAIRFIGDLSAFSEKLQIKMQEVSALQPEDKRLTLHVAVNYGGRWDIVQAAKQLASMHQQGTLDLSDIDESLFNRHTCLSQQPPIDLLIRTGGEQRISNFLLWQCAYTELFFIDTLWPDFDEKVLQSVLVDYNKRERRFGQTSDQLNA